MRRRGLILFTFAFLVLSAPADAVDTPAVSLHSMGTFDSPVFITSDPTNADRLLVVEKDGRIVASQNGVKSTFLDIDSQVSSCNERGMLSAAFPSDYATTGLFYVLYNRNDGDIQIDEFRTQAGAVVMSSQRHVLTIDHPDNCQHNGGQMQFGPDGDLYISTGDGNEDGWTSQDNGVLLGKLLRIWPRPGLTTQYTIPLGNPYRGSIPGSDEIWSSGLRNPWRFSFDRLTGDLVIGDVGNTDWEEIDFEPAPNGGQGDNFGWPTCEGPVFLNPDPPTPVGSSCTFGARPVYSYEHTDGRCAITGGYVVRDQSLATLYGRYVFADLCTGQLYSAHLESPTTTDVRTEPLQVETPSTFGEDACGRVYVAELGGSVFRLVGPTPAGCGSSDPGTGDPGTGDPGTGDPGSDDPGAGDPGTGDPGTGDGDEPAATCGGRTATLTPAGGKVDGTPDADVIVAGDETDKIAGHGGDDVICAGDGDDTVKGGGGDDVLRGGPGADALFGNGGDDRCKGGPGKDRVKSC